MNNPHDRTRHMPQLTIDTGEILGHIAGARNTPCRDCDAAKSVLITDIARLLAEITRLYKSLNRQRQRAANLEAAINAALRAHDEGETDALDYLRDQITADPGAAHGA